MKIVADDKIPFLPGAFESAGCQAVYLPGKEISPEDLRDADALIVRTRTKCDKSLLQKSNVKFGATATLGFDHIIPEHLTELGITWCNAPGCNSSSVAQYITSVLVTLGDYSGKTLGVIGAGNVGKKVIKCAEALGMKVLVNDPPRMEKEGKDGFVSLDTIAAESDFITLHVPLTNNGAYPTWQMCGTEFFSKVKKGVVFINTSRGETVNTAALIEAKKRGIISKIAVDVWENEPDIDLELLEKHSVIATSHIAGYSTDGKANATNASVRSVAAALGIKELENWDCRDRLPAPDEGEEICLPSGISVADAVKFAVLHSYNVSIDSEDLKRDASKFEKLRGSYRTRREFFAFKVRNAAPDSEEILQNLGFVTE